MAKRLTDTDKWKDDWYISLSNDYRIIWQWLLDNCNHAGICKRSIALLNRDCNTNISEEDLLAVMVDRVVPKGTIWFIPKFLKFQYPSLLSKKPVIVSVVKELEKNALLGMIPQSFGNDYIIIKDKDKDKDKDIVDTTSSISTREEAEEAGQLFEEFWQVYGKKEGRHPCEQEWYLMKHQDRIKAVAAVKVYVKAKEMRVRFAPLKWLQQRRWEDEYGPPALQGRQSTYVMKRDDFYTEQEWQDHLKKQDSKAA